MKGLANTTFRRQTSCSTVLWIVAHRPAPIISFWPTALACSLSLLTTSSLIAQEPSTAPQLLTPVSSWQSPEELKSTVAVEGLRVEMHSKVLAGGAPHFSFQAFNGKVYQADLEELKWNDLGAATWVGQISEFGEHSEVLLSTFDGAVAGTIDTPDGRYEIDPTPDGHILMKVDSSRFGGCATKGPGHRPSGGRNGHRTRRRDGGPQTRGLGRYWA